MITAAHICHRCDQCLKGKWSCAKTGKPIHVHAATNDCPLGKFAPAGDFVSGPAPATPRLAIDPASGRALWTELHHRPATCTLATEEKWFAGWLARIPCGQCKASAAAILKAMPAAFVAWATAPEGRMQYARWGWQFHNAVSARIPGKPELSWDEAAKQWGWLSAEHRHD